MAKAFGRINFGDEANINLESLEMDSKLELRGFETDAEGAEAIEDAVEGVLQAEVEAEPVVEPVVAPPVANALPVRTQERVFVSQLRQADPADKKTCAACKRRVPLAFIAFGHAEVCDDCK